MFQTTTAPRKKRIAISLGDPNGIGAEVTLKCLRKGLIPSDIDPILIGSLEALRIQAAKLGMDAGQFRRVNPFLQTVSFKQSGQTWDVLDCYDKPYITAWGRPSELSGRISMRAVELAIEACQYGSADAMVTAPISKEAIQMAGYKVPGHTEFIAGKLATDQFTMMMVCDDLRVGLVTTHVPIHQVASLITKEAVLQKIQIIHHSLRTDFALQRPKIAILGLNPHAGDGGVLGWEEERILKPAIQQARQAGLEVSDPFPADGFFATRRWKQYDAVLAMYHDQGLIPFKTIAFDRGVNFTAGLPIIRTSPDHGTAYDIAGKNMAEPSSMADAIQLALDLAKMRQTV